MCNCAGTCVRNDSRAESRVGYSNHYSSTGNNGAIQSLRGANWGHGYHLTTAGARCWIDGTPRLNTSSKGETSNCHNPRWWLRDVNSDAYYHGSGTRTTYRNLCIKLFTDVEQVFFVTVIEIRAHCIVGLYVTSGPTWSCAFFI